MLVALVGLLAMGGCVRPAAPEPAVVRESAPPWDAPRDAISQIQLAKVAELPLNDTSDPHIIDFQVVVDGQPVTVPAYIGIDRRRAVQAPVHTHDDSGKVWLEGQGNRTITLGEFFTLWGVRFDGTCLGSACASVTVTADGKPVTDPVRFVLRGTQKVVVSATS